MWTEESLFNLFAGLHNELEVVRMSNIELKFIMISSSDHCLVALVTAMLIAVEVLLITLMVVGEGP